MNTDYLWDKFFSSAALTKEDQDWAIQNYPVAEYAHDPAA